MGTIILGNAHGKLFMLQGVLGFGGEWDSYSSRRCYSHGCTEEDYWRSKVKRFESQELYISSIRSFDFGDGPQQGYNEEHMRFYEAKISRYNMSQACTLANSPEGVWNSSFESRRIYEWVLCSDPDHS